MRSKNKSTATANFQPLYLTFNFCFLYLVQPRLRKWLAKSHYRLKVQTFFRTRDSLSSQICQNESPFRWFVNFSWSGFEFKSHLNSKLDQKNLTKNVRKSASSENCSYYKIFGYFWTILKTSLFDKAVVATFGLFLEYPDSF